MLVFIDESGDGGLDVDEGASAVVVVALILFANDSAAAEAQHAIEASEARRRHKPEFKFSKCRDDVRDSFFAAVREQSFTVRAIIVDKVRPRSAAPAGRRNAEALAGASVMIDGSGSRPFRLTLNTAVRRALPPGSLRAVRFKESKREVPIQLADMCAGAIARAYRPDRTRADRWLEALRPRIGDFWGAPRGRVLPVEVGSTQGIVDCPGS